MSGSRVPAPVDPASLCGPCGPALSSHRGAAVPHTSAIVYRLARPCTRPVRAKLRFLRNTASEPLPVPRAGEHQPPHACTRWRYRFVLNVCATHGSQMTLLCPPAMRLAAVLPLPTRSHVVCPDLGGPSHHESNARGMEVQFRVPPVLNLSTHVEHPNEVARFSIHAPHAPARTVAGGTGRQAWPGQGRWMDNGVRGPHQN